MNKQIEFTDDEIQEIKNLVEILKTHNGINTFEEIFGIIRKLRDDNGVLQETERQGLLDLSGGYVARLGVDMSWLRQPVEILNKKFPRP